MPEAPEYIKLSAKDGGRKVLALNVMVISWSLDSSQFSKSPKPRTFQDSAKSSLYS